MPGLGAAVGVALALGTAYSAEAVASLLGAAEGVDATAKAVEWWISLAAAVLCAVAGATWAVASKVYGLENRMNVMETSHDLVSRQLDWLTKTVWEGRPTEPPPERKVRE